MFEALISAECFILQMIWAAAHRLWGGGERGEALRIFLRAMVTDRVFADLMTGLSHRSRSFFTQTLTAFAIEQNTAISEIRVHFSRICDFCPRARYQFLNKYRRRVFIRRQKRFRNVRFFPWQTSAYADLPWLASLHLH